MTATRGRRYTSTEVDELVGRYRQENEQLRAQNVRLRADLATAWRRADEVFAQFEALAREVGRLDVMGAHPSLAGESVGVRPARTHLTVVRDGSPATNAKGER